MQAKVKAGVSTFSLGGVSLAAYVLAIVAFVQGARDEATISAAAIGTVALVTMAAGRFWQAVAKIRVEQAKAAKSSTTTPKELMAFSNITAPVAGSGTVFSGQTTTTPRPSAGIDWAGAKDSQMAEAIEHADGPGDELHPIFEDEHPADPTTIPADVGDAKAAKAWTTHPTASAASAASTGAVSGLNASQRAKAREMIIQAAYLALRHAPVIHYTQGNRRWEGIDNKLRAWRGEYPHQADCSSFATWVLWQGLGHFHVRDVVNGAGWLAGYTGTMLGHGKLVRHERNIKHGDLALYDGHVAICVGGGMVISHGSEGGPYLLPIHYRSDLLEVRRFV
jgi:hypothetical protein